MKTLYYVDDEDGQVPMLEASLAALSCDYSLKPYVYGARVKQFMNEATTCLQDPEARFLLDIYMPPPRSLRLEDVWPKRNPGEDHFCGIALAKWLVVRHKITVERIALYTHVDRQSEHDIALLELFPAAQPRRFDKADLEGIGKWLGF